MAISGPQIVKINKKTGSGDYTLYHPQTDTSVILHLGDTTDPDFSGLTRYNAQGDQSSTGGYYHVKDVLDVIFTKLGTVANVLEFKGVVATWADLPTALASTVGDVYGVNEAHDGYPAGTLYVGCDNGESATTRYTWTPLGGKGSSVYALKTEAIKYLTLSNDGEILYGYASESQATRSLGSVALQNQAIGDLFIDSNGLHGRHVDNSSFTMAGLVTDTVASGSYALVSADAVYNFASTAGTVNVSTDIEQSTDATYYLTFVSGSSAGGKTVYIDSDRSALKYNPYKHLLDTGITGYASYAYEVEVQAPINTGYLLGMSSSSAVKETISPAQSGIKWDTTAAGAGTASKYLNVNITGKAATAGSADTATKVGHTFTVAGQAFDGSTTKTVTVGNGLTITPSGNTTTISIGEGDGITVDANSISVNAGNGLAYSNDQIVAKATAGLTVTANGIGINNSITSGVYSAVAVNQYGLATAGGQAVVFANSTSDPDLNQLVVGGLAFISTSETAKTGTVPTNSIDLNN